MHINAVTMVFTGENVNYKDYSASHSGWIYPLNYFGKVVLDKQFNQMTIDPEAR